MMKKLLAFFLAMIIMLSFAGCGGNSEVTEEEQKENEIPEENVPETKVYSLGDTIETDLFIITPSFTGYAHELANWPDENYMTPEGEFSGTSPYSAEEGKVSMYGEIKIEYIGNEKEDVSLAIDLSADYDNGYVFSGEDVHTGYCLSIDGDWEYDEEMFFEPLSDETSRILRYCIEVPEQVETNADNPLLVTFFVNGEPYVFDFRSAEVLSSDYDPRWEFYQSIDEETKNQIVNYLKKNGLVEMGWYAGTYNVVNYYTFTFDDSTVTATLPINDYYQYNFSGTYEIFSGTILITWSNGEQMHLDYSFDGTNFEVVDFEHGR